MLAKHWQHWQSVGKFADVLPTLPTDGQHWPDLACLLGSYWIGRCLFCMKEAKKSKVFFEKAVKILERASLDVQNDRSIADSKTWIGRCLFDMKEFEKGQHVFMSAVPVYDDSSVDVTTDFDLAKATFWLGRCLFDAKNPEKGKLFFERSLKIYEKLFDLEQPHTSHDLFETSYWIGRCLFKVNDLELAKVFFERALGIAESISRDVTVDRVVADITSYIGCSLMNLENPGKAKIFF